VWSDVGGQDDLIWYAGVNQGGGTWRASINLASHPGIGTINVHIYMNGSVWCNTANFTRNATSCNLPWGGTVADGGTVTAWQTSSSCGGCVSQVRTCNNGTLSGTYQFQNCNNATCASCTSPCGAVTHGAWKTCYQSSNPTCPGSCTSASAYCNNGTLTSGTIPVAYTAATCTNPTVIPILGTKADSAAAQAELADKTMERKPRQSIADETTESK
jgi:hypothetical protein